MSKSNLGFSAVSDNSKETSVGQLHLKLEASKVETQSSSVVRLLDAETRAVRKQAIERVISTGIFNPPKSNVVR